MALPKLPQQRSGNGSRNASSVAKKVTPKQPKNTRKTSARVSPRLTLTKKRASAGRSYTGRGKQFGGHLQAKSAPASRAGSNSSGNKRGARGATRAACVKESGVTLAGCETNDKGKKAVQALRDDLKKDARNSIGEAEAECEKLVLNALGSSSEGMVGKEADEDEAETRFREIETRQAFVATGCSEMLKALANHRTTLAGLAKRYATALESMGKAENRKLDSSLERKLRTRS